MPTLGATITGSSWTNLVTRFSLLPGEEHTIQNFGPVDLFLTEQAVSPTDPVNDVPRIRVYPGNSFTFIVNPGFYLFARSKYDATTTIYIQRTGGAVNRFLLNRLLSDNGLPDGNLDQTADYSATPTDFYVEALAGERLSVARIIIFIRAGGNIGVAEYGDIAGGLANGIKLFYKVGGAKLDVTDGRDIMINEDWGRYCYDSDPVGIGPTQNTPIWRIRWTFEKYGNPFGLFLEEGDQLGGIFNDDFSSLVDHTLVAEGIHWGTPNPAWLFIIP